MQSMAGLFFLMIEVHRRGERPNHMTSSPTLPSYPDRARPRGDQEAWTAWMRRRLARHIPELIRLALPAIGSRVGILLMGFTDTLMVGRYGTDDLAALTLASQGLIGPMLMIGIGLLMGVMVHAASLYGAGRESEVGAVFWRNIPYSLGIGLVMVALCLGSGPFYTLLGQAPDLAADAVPLTIILALGLPGHLLFYLVIASLDGVKRPMAALYAIILGNVLNVGLNYLLIYGPGVFPELGAVGSAWATTILRWLGAALMITYVMRAPSLRLFAFDKPLWSVWRGWSEQRRLGYAAAISLGAEVTAFGGLSIIAGALSTLTVAAFGIAFNMLSLAFMIAVGIGTAASVRVSIAMGRGDKEDGLLAGWTGLGLGWAILLPLGLLISTQAEFFFHLYSNDALLLPIAAGMMAYTLIILPFDGGQFIMSMALRGAQDSWWPTVIQIISYLVFMIPLCIYLAFTIGPNGLMIGTFVASVVSLSLLSVRFYRLLR